ncbi:MAG: pseudouridine-5'-phosphate glycosidase [Myxococcales bacterium]|nr:pseudouridine-5'-phosphate glycosidase [Myxococcales bacterium]
MATRLWQARSVIVIAQEVLDALESGRAVVALESTIIAHGLPYPENEGLAARLEEKVREYGAVPATIAVLAGKACIGLDAQELECLASPESNVKKAGASDLCVAMAKGGDAATTVSGTSALAALAGIRFFATGCIGGVHPGDDFDVSADLLSLSREPLAVVSAGPKAILDLPRTMEALESLSVLVLGYGTDELPGFYSRESGISLEHRVDTPEIAARALDMRWNAMEQGGALIANPEPEDVALPMATVAAWIAEAASAAKRDGATGKALTPYLLQFLAKTSGGSAVETNCALALSNARVAAEIAVAHSNLRRG